MINDDTQEQLDAASPTGDVGNQLRKAREAKGISVAQVADSQHLRPSVIQDIEDGQYHKIGSELFLKGYIRAYAEQVGLDASSLIEKLDFELEPLRRQEEAAHHDNPLETIERKKRQKRRIARWIILILLLAALAVVGTRLVEMELYSGIMGPADESNAVTEQSEPATDQAPATGQDQVGEPEMTADGELDAAPAADSDKQASEAVEGTTTETPAPETGMADQSEPVGAAESAAGNASESATEASQPVAEQPEPAAAVEPAPEPVVSGDVLTATFTADCWVSVKNAEGTTVVASLKRAGESLRYEGQGPFRIVLGAADAATLSFNGEVVDLSGYPAPNNRIALTLGN